MFFGQTFEPHDLAVIGVLILLEGILSIDNALVLGVLAKRLPKHLQKKALTYGLIGAFVFRIIAVATAAWLIQIRWIKLLGGAYLVYIAVKHFFFDAKEGAEGVKIGADGHPVIADEADSAKAALGPVAVEAGTIGAAATIATGAVVAEAAAVGGGAGFWQTVAVIELTDVAFAVDSILAAVGMVSSASKTWVVITGGILGVVMMRFAAALFIKLLEKFPRFEVSAYLLVLWIGLKLMADWTFNSPEHPHALDFHSFRSPWTYLFWGGMLAAFCYGFVGGKKAEQAPTPV